MPSIAPPVRDSPARLAAGGAPAVRGLALLVPLVLFAPFATPSRAQGEERAVRWKLGPTEGLVYELRGAGASSLTGSGVATRTVYGADLLDGRVPREPVGRAEDLVFHYLLQLPEEAFVRSFERPVDDRYTLAGRDSVRVVGRLRASLRGEKLTTRWELRLKTKAYSRQMPAAGDVGRLVVKGVFDRKEGVLLRGSYDLRHTATAWGNKTFSTGKVALKDRVALAEPAFRRRVDQAVQRALEKVLRPALARGTGLVPGDSQGPVMGRLALALYAAVRAGLSPRDPVAQAAYRHLASLTPEDTYSVSVAILALEARSFQRAGPARERGGQTVARLRFRKGDIAKADRARMEQLARWLLDARHPGQGTWGYVSAKATNAQGLRVPYYADHSNTQFAVLALHAAQRSGVEVPRAVWEEIGRHFVGVQLPGPTYDAKLELEAGALLGASEAGEPAGGSRAGAGTHSRGSPDGSPGGPGEWAGRARGFCYNLKGRRVSASITAAGTSSLAITYRWLRAALAANDPLLAKVRRGTLDGLRWLARHHTMRHNWPDDSFPFCHLYSLEKALDICGVARIDDHDWWAEGAEELLLRQTPGGRWGRTPAVAEATAFAVLFLTRASREPERKSEKPASGTNEERARGTTVGRAAKDRAPDAVRVDGVGVVRVREVVRALVVADARRRQERLALLERAFEALERDRRPLLIPELAKLWDNRFSDVRRGTQSLLKEIVGRRVKGAQEALAIHARWKQVVALGEARDPIAIPELRTLLAKEEKETPRCVRRAVVHALSQLHAVEATGDLFSELVQRDQAYRRLVAAVLGQLLGEEAGYDATASQRVRRRALARWRAVWEARRAKLLAKEELLRLVATLGVEARAKDAARRLEARGEAAIGPLIEALGTKATYGDGERRDARASALLQTLTGEKQGLDRAFWEAWRKRTGRGG